MVIRQIHRLKFIGQELAEYRDLKKSLESLKIAKILALDKLGAMLMVSIGSVDNLGIVYYYLRNNEKAEQNYSEA